MRITTKEPHSGWTRRGFGRSKIDLDTSDAERTVSQSRQTTKHLRTARAAGVLRRLAGVADVAAALLVGGASQGPVTNHLWLRQATAHAVTPATHPGRVSSARPQATDAAHQTESLRSSIGTSTMRKLAEAGNSFPEKGNRGGGFF